MAGLDDRQIEILDKIGIELWRRREARPELQSEPEVTEPEIINEVSAASGSDVLPAGPDSGNETERLRQLAETICECRKCPLHRTRTKAVPGVGSAFARWMFVGEAPGQNEDLQGQPFVGRAGQLLDAMIAALKMARKDVFIANVIKCRPPGNRNPVVEEINQCEPYLHRQLAIIRPAIIVALGAVSAQSLLKTSDPIGRLRGRVFHYGEPGIPLIPTYHPAYLLRSPMQKKKAWEDLLLARSIVGDGVRTPEKGPGSVPTDMRSGGQTDNEPLSGK